VTREEERRNPPGRPVLNIEFSSDEYLSAEEARKIFRRVAKIFKLKRSKVWSKLQVKCTSEEIRLISDFFNDKACAYSYNRAGEKRDVDERSQSLISSLCYKVNKGHQDEYCRSPLLTMAFLQARSEIIEHFSTAASAD